MSAPKRILIVDDNDVFRSLLEDFFKDQGFDVTVAASVDRGKEFVSRFKPEVVLLDIDIAGVSGTEVMSEVRKVQGSSVPVVFITGSRAGTPMNLGQFPKIPEDCKLLFKPVELSFLRFTVEKMLKESNGG